MNAMVRFRFHLTFCTLLGLCGANLLAQDQPDKAAPADFVTVQIGTMPIILTAPHGGERQIPNLAERRGEGISKFVALRDGGTSELTEKLATELMKRTEQRPFVVIARFHRRYIDANRPPDLAFESPEAKPYYDAYHQAVKEACRIVQQKWKRGLLLDIHGQSAEPAAIFRGTNNGRSVEALVERFGRPALIGENSLLGQLARNSFTVIPAVGSDDAEDKRYNGGHTVQTYGSHRGTAMDAIQLEFGTKLRAREQLDQTASRVAGAVKAFADEFVREVSSSGTRDPS